MDLNAWTFAQKSVIGCLLLWPDETAGEIFQRAKPEHFGSAELRHVFEAARGIWETNRPLDPVTVLAASGDDYGKLLADCMQETPTAANVSAWLDLMRSGARMSALQAQALAIMNAESEAEAVEVYERMGQMLQESGSVQVRTLTELISDYLDRMQDKKPVRYLNWGIESLDKTLYVSKGQFGLIAADSSVGKTALALQFAVHMAGTGLRVGFISLETPWESLEDRLMAETQLSSIPLPTTKRKELSEEEFRRAAESGVRSDRMPLKLVRNCMTLPEIRSVILQHRLDVAIIDYVQLIDAPGRERWDIVTNISMSLHRMAQQIGAVIIGLSQVTPPSKGSKSPPSKDDLRESRQLKQDADFILILSPSTDEEDPPNTRVLEIAKNKDGRCARLKLHFEPEHMTFSYRPTVNAMRAEGQAKKNAKPTKAAEVPEDVKPGQLVELPEEYVQEELPFEATEK